MGDELRPHIFVNWIALGEGEGDLKHVQTVESHPGSSIGLL